MKKLLMLLMRPPRRQCAGDTDVWIEAGLTGRSGLKAKPEKL